MMFNKYIPKFIRDDVLAKAIIDALLQPLYDRYRVIKNLPGRIYAATAPEEALNQLLYLIGAPKLTEQLSEEHRRAAIPWGRRIWLDGGLSRGIENYLLYFLRIDATVSVHPNSVGFIVNVNKCGDIIHDDNYYGAGVIDVNINPYNFTEDEIRSALEPYLPNFQGYDIII